MEVKFSQKETLSFLKSDTRIANIHKNNKDTKASEPVVWLSELAKQLDGPSAVQPVQQ